MDFTHAHFEAPRWLWLAVVGPALLFWLQRHAAGARRQQLARVASPHFVADLTRSHSPARRGFKNILLVGVLALIGLALARPQWGEWQSRDQWSGEDVMFVLDCSRSMLATDITPNRLQRAKFAVLDFVRSHSSGRVGVVAFAGSAFLQCPLTFDYGAFEETLTEMDERTIPVGGTDVGRALHEAQQAMEKKNSRKLIVLLTDGEDLAKSGVREAESLAKAGVTVYTVGVGTAAGSEIRALTPEGQMEFVRDEKGEIVRSRLDEATLTAIAKTTGGKYEPLGRLGEGLAKVREALENTGAAKPGRAASRGVERFHWPLAFALALLVGESLIGTRRRMSAIQSAPATVILVAGMISISNTTLAATNGTTNAIAPMPVRVPDSARGFYNLGSQQLHAGKLMEAEISFRTALARQDETIQPLALYNAGHVRFAQGVEELKKGPPPKAAKLRGDQSVQEAGSASQTAREALASEDIQKMVAAYLGGRGAKKELRAALSSVQKAMEAHVKTLLKWRRALGDFQSAVELNPSDTNATHNVEVVERAIADLVDQLRQMQAMAMAGLGAKVDLEGLLEQLKGKIPKENMPPGAAGEDAEEEPGGLSLEEIRDLVEGAPKDGREMEVPLSREEAAGLLDGFKLGGNRRLPMGGGDKGDPKDRKRRNW